MDKQAYQPVYCIRIYTSCPIYQAYCCSDISVLSLTWTSFANLTQTLFLGVGVGKYDHRQGRWNLHAKIQHRWHVLPVTVATIDDVVLRPLCRIGFPLRGLKVRVRVSLDRQGRRSRLSCPLRVGTSTASAFKPMKYGISSLGPFSYAHGVVEDFTHTPITWLVSLCPCVLLPPPTLDEDTIVSCRQYPVNHHG